MQFTCLVSTDAAACAKLHSDDDGSAYEVKGIETTTVNGKELMKLLMAPVENE
jgi:hypothetical protein